MRCDPYEVVLVASAALRYGSRVLDIDRASPLTGRLLFTDDFVINSVLPVGVLDQVVGGLVARDNCWSVRYMINIEV